MLDIDTVLGWRGKPVLDRDGEKVGTLGEIYLDDATDRPAYAGVTTGLFKRRESVVPLEGAQETPEGIRLPYTADRIKDAPNVDPDVALDDDEQQRLVAHFDDREPEGREDAGAEAARAAEPAAEEDAAPTAGEESVPAGEEDAAPTAGEDPAPAADDDAAPTADEDAAPTADDDAAPTAGGREGAEVVRSEEEVSFGTRAAPRERVRLRKHVVTENVEKTVPVRREEVRVETDPPQEGRIVDVEDVERE